MQVKDPLVFKENNITLILHKLALSPVPVKSLGDRGVVKDVVLAKLGFLVLCGLDRIIEWHLREHVVALVGVANMMVQMVHDRAKGAVDSAGSSALEVPDVIA